jgi:hypothetical protein
MQARPEEFNVAEDFSQVHRQCIARGTGRAPYVALRGRGVLERLRGTPAEAASIILHQGTTAVHGRGIAFGRRATVRFRFVVICSLSLILALALPGWGQSSVGQDSTLTPKSAHTKKKASSPGKEIGKGGEDMGKGAAKGSADLAKGAAGGVGNLATGHPVGAVASTGKGVGEFGENVGVGTGKGVAKIGKGVGGELKKLGHKSEKKDEKSQ